MPHSAGEKIGAYEILGPLGTGGMGEVYRARDTKLGRDVALKVLPQAVAGDAQRMARFAREAQVLASLNHPNIAAIYGLEESGGVRALVMELVEGQTLGERIGAFHHPLAPSSGRRGVSDSPPESGGGRGVVEMGERPSPLPLDEALPIAKQLAEALEAAHERGIVHRDLKPANIKITPEGAVKVLDFGLAKAFEIQDSSTNVANSPTLSVAATQGGMILGTAAYMSPEQARGKPADRRADIWSFGCVLYEMLTGRQLFRGETVSDILAAVIRADPEWEGLPATVPPRIRQLLSRCLEREPKRRLQAIGEARIAIEETLSGDVGAGLVPTLPTSATGIAPGRPQGSPLRRKLAWALAGLIVGALASGLVVWRLEPRALGPASMHFSAITSFSGVQTQPALSPDGRSVAFVSNRDGPYNIYVGLASGGSLVQVTNDSNLKSRPTWSPDGTRIAYARVNDSGTWDVWEAPSLGGTPRRLILNATDPTWSPDGHSLAYENKANGAIWVSSDSGQNSRQVSPPPPPAQQDTEPRFSPDGRSIAFAGRAEGPYGELALLDLASGNVSQLTEDIALVLSPAWSPDSRTIYFASSRGGTFNIWKIAAARGGEPEQITSGQGDDVQLNVSADGKRIVFTTFRENINIAQLDLKARPGEQSVRLLTRDRARNQFGPAYSPDGKRLAYFSNLKGAEKEGIWLANADGSDPLQLVQDDRVNIYPRWTPDGSYLVYTSALSPLSPATWECRRVSASGGAPETVRLSGPVHQIDVGPGGRILFVSPQGQVQAFDPRDNKTETLATLPPNQKWWLLRWSPDEHSMAYLVDPNLDNDPNAGVWVTDFKSPPRQVFRGWVVYYSTGPRDQIYLLQGKPDLNGVLWKVGWDGQGLTRTSTTVRLPYYYNYEAAPLREFFDVSPDGSHLAIGVQEVLQANIGMIEGIR